MDTWYVVYDDSNGGSAEVVQELANIAKGKLILSVRPREGDNVAHVHVFRKGQEDKDVCVCLDQNKYFKHGSHQREFGKKTGITKQEFIVALNDEEKGMPMWDFLCYEWNRTHPEHKRDFPDKMPDYNTMTDSLVSNHKK